MKGEQVNKSIAMDQWFEVQNTLRWWGVKVETIMQANDLPDMVFTANAGTV